MFRKLRTFLQGSNGIYLAIGLAVVGVGAVIYSLMSGGPDVSITNHRMYIDPKTGRVFAQTIEIGKKPEPTFCPDCGRLVLAYNPPPVPGVVAPPTKPEYDKNPKKNPLR